VYLPVDIQKCSQGCRSGARIRRSTCVDFHCIACGARLKPIVVCESCRDVRAGP
jgi:hypothetical protein